ncbi:MAG: 4Fe-4S binding protein, partial [Clostridia bacterium]|nr:4Fe-4S binding protein [Clostridia bacterium]
DAAHQAIEWNEKKRKPELIEDNCVGCHLCLNVCPVQECIVPGEFKKKKGHKMSKNIKFKQHYE